MGMERKAGGCCIAPRYGAAAGTAVQQQQQAGAAAWQMGRIMLKFRPIAPKPATMAPAPPTPVAVPAGRGGKRKSVCGGGSAGRRGRKAKKAATAAAVAAAPVAKDAGDCGKHCDKEKSPSTSPSSSSSGMTSMDSSPPPPHGMQHQHQQQLATLLPLMPVMVVEDNKAAAAAAEEPTPASASASASVPSQVAAAPAAVVAAGARPLAPRAMRPAAVASLVTVEEVTATWRDGEAPACVGADDEAPAFVSDQWGRVTWMNAVFVRAVSADDDGDVADAPPPPVAVVGALPAWGTCAGFTCRVRVQHSSPRRVGSSSSSSSVVAPCDVWRLDAAGSYLWRLDLQAALTLGGGL